MRKSRLFIIFSMVAVFLSACHQGGDVKYSQEADKLIEKVRQSRNFQHLITLADSLRQEGLISDAKAFYWQGYACDHQMRQRTADFYWNRAIEAAAKSENPEEMDFYAKSASRLANMLMTRGDYEGTVKMAVPVVRRLEALQCDTTSDYVNTLIYIGCCQLGLGMYGDSINDNFFRAYKKHTSDIEVKHSDDAYKNAFAGVINIVYAFNTTGHYDDALKWNERYGKLITEYEQRQDANPNYIDKQWARYDIYQAIALAGLNRNDEAENAYNDYLKTAYSKTPEGSIVSNDYLEPQGRWKEVAANYESLDKIVDEFNAKHSLENVQKVALKKYRANLLAGRRDTAMAVSMQISEMLDSAIARSRRTDAEEMKVIREKELEIVAERDELARQHTLGIYGIFAVVIVLLILYIFYHIYVRYRLKQGYKQLKADFTQVEASSAEKERLDTEQRMAHNILISDQPQPFPTVGDLSYGATPIPAASIFSDFYDYRLVDGRLYLCAASALGNEVNAAHAASLVRSQFRAMASLETSPDRIVTAINDTMAAGDHTPVKLFIGALDLASGELVYCNAGHPLPVIAGETFRQLTDGDDIAVGVESGVAFTLQQTVIEPSSLIFLYTRSLLDVRDAKDKAFGEKRMLGEALQAKKTSTAPTDFIGRMSEAIYRFSGTKVTLPPMLAIQYK